MAIRSGQSHPGLSTHPQPDWQQLKSCSFCAIRPPDRCGRVRAVRNSPSDVVVCQRVVRRQTCYPATRRSTRATQARGVSSAHVGQPAPEIAFKASHKVRHRPKKCLEWTSARPHAAKSPAASFVTNRHGRKVLVLISPLFWVILAKHFRAKADLPNYIPFGVWLNSTRLGRTRGR